ncbi:MAG: FecCD family ABC transporter permease [Coriobacteriales bacterium]
MADKPKRRRNASAGRRANDAGTPVRDSAGSITLEDQEDNVYRLARDAGHKVDPRLQVVFVLCALLAALYFFGLIVPKDLLNSAVHNSGMSGGYSFAWFVEDLQDNIAGLVGVLTGHDDGPVSFGSTMIRYAIIAMTGAGLALCGAVYQGAFKNALVSPSTLGVHSGATLGLMIWVVFFVADDGSNVTWLSGYNGSGTGWDYLVSTYSLSAISFAGCLLVVGSVLLVMRLAGRGRSNSAIMMIICGQVIGSVLGAVSNSVRYWYVAGDPYSAKASLLTDLQIASFYRSYELIDIAAIGIPLIAAFAAVMVLRRRMSLMSMGAEEARTLGVDAAKMNYVVVGLCTLLTAILISFCGSVGFVGFLVPHMARRLVGPDFGYLLPAAAVLGSVFVLGAFVLMSMTLGPAYETMVGMFISIFGAAVFLATALRGEGGARGEFR